jgi:hypothetical protein
VTYTQLSITAIVLAVAVDLWIVRGQVLKQRVFWASYAIVVFFQLLSNGAFTGLGIVKYDDSAIVGGTSPADGAPTMFGDGRIAFAPIEDLGFGFALVVLSVSLWVALERRGLDAETTAGPPRVKWFSGRPKS